MAATDATFEQGAGAPEQLEQGAAQTLNENLPTTSPGEPESPAADAAAAAVPAGVDVAVGAPLQPAPPAEEEVPVEMAVPADYAPEFEPVDEDDMFITGPTGRPAEAETVGARRRTGLSNSVRRALPALEAAAAAPGASPALRRLVSLLLKENR